MNTPTADRDPGAPVTPGARFASTRDRIEPPAQEGIAVPEAPHASAADGRARARTLLLRTPPPLVFVAAFLAGVALQRLLALPVPSGLQAELAWKAGAALLALGFLFGPVNALMFLARGTTLNPMRAPQRLFTGGAYRISRNPMYLGLLFIHAGVALLHAQWVALLLITLPFAVVDRVYIPCEESFMARTFGAQYLAYGRRVRRWIGVRRQRR